jgi:hypothetical protein
VLSTRDYIPHQTALHLKWMTFRDDLLRDEFLNRLRELHLVVTGCEPGNELPSVRLYLPQVLHRNRILPMKLRWPPWLRLLPCSGNLIHPIDFAELVQKLWNAVIEAHDFAKLGAIAHLVLYNFAPDFDLAE